MVCEEPIAPTTAMPAMNNKTQSKARNRADPDVPFGLEIMDAPERSCTPNRTNLSTLGSFMSLTEQFDFGYALPSAAHQAG